MTCSRHIQLLYLLLTVTVNDMQQTHPADISPIEALLMACSRHIKLIYLLLTVTVNDIQQMHPVDISPIKAQSLLIDYGLWGFYRVLVKI